MRPPVWVMKETVVALQERLLAEFGGASGLRDEGLLDSALAQPANLLAYGKPSLFEVASSYAQGLVHNRPFREGNKRIGFTTAVTFLELNGHNFIASEVDAIVQTLALAAGDVDELGYAVWLKENSRKLQNPSRKEVARVIQKTMKEYARTMGRLA